MHVKDRLEPTRLSRRDFLAAAAILAGVAPAVAQQRKKPRLAFSTWSLHNYFRTTRNRPAFGAADWTLQKAVLAVRDKLDLRHFEISTSHLESTKPRYLAEMAEFFLNEKCSIIHLADNFRGVNLCSASLGERQKDIGLYKKWMEIAAQLGAPSLRVDPGSPERVREWNVQLTIETFQELARFGKPLNVQVVVENQAGISADPKNVVRIVEAVKENISACPDIGTFAGATRIEDLTLMLPHARHICSTKFHEFDAGGGHKDFNYQRCLETLRDRGFAGWASLEYQGRQDPWKHIEQGKKLATEVLGV